MPTTNIPRRFPRQAVERILSMDMEPNNHAIVLNFSEEGLAFRALNPVTQLGHLKFSFFDKGEKIQASGELVWTDPSQTSGGLRFAPMPKWTRDRLRNWIRADIADSGVPLHEPASREPRESQPAAASPEASPHYSYTPPSWNPQSGPPPTFALMGDDPEYSRYAEMGLPTSRGKYFSGFLMGAVITAIAAAALVFVYGTTINQALNQGRAAIGLSPATAPPAASVPTTPGGSTPLPPAPAAVAPSPSAAGSAAAGTTQAPIVPAPAPNPGDTSNAYSGTAPPNTLPPAPTAMPSLPSQPAMPVQQPSNQAPAATSRGGLANPASDSGAAELAMAQRYLNPKSGAAEHAAAVPALWDAIQKGNLQAEVMLADLYARGDGVTKNCNQARVLLRAAAERGNSEASQKLAQIVRSGCR